MQVNHRYTFLILLSFLVTVLVPAAASAEENKRKRFVASLGAFSAKTNTEIRLDATDGSFGTSLNLEDDLDFGDSESLPWIDFFARLGNRHRVGITYYDLSRSSVKQLSGEVKLGDSTFPVSAQVDSFFESRIFRLAYGYSFSQSDNHEAGLLAGLHVTEIGLGMKTLNGVVDESADATAPLPMFGLFGSVALPHKWRFRGWGQVFALNFENFDGSMLNVTAVVEHDTFDNVGFGFGYSLFQFDLKAEDADLRGDFKYAFQGPTAYMNIMF